MIVSDQDARRPEQRIKKTSLGWTGLHSWIFLMIVLVGMGILAIQNRYFYVSPLGLGKAYRIDKLLGGIQEFHPDKGWVKADIPSGPPQQPMSMMPPSPGSQPLGMNLPSLSGPPGSPALPMNMPGTMVPPIGAKEPPAAKQRVAQKEDPEEEPIKREATKPAPAPKPSVASKEPVAQPPSTELTEEERLSLFQKRFPAFGPQEFRLANDDLYPNWKKSLGHNGDWAAFLETYADFIDWWLDSGSPQKAGFQLWQDYMATKDQPGTE